MSLSSKGKRSWKRWLSGKRKDVWGVFGKKLSATYEKVQR